MATDIDQWLFQHDPTLDQQVTSVLASPSCAPLYAALCRAYGSHFALDLGRTCIVQDGGVGLEQSFNYWARYHLRLAPPPLPQHAPPPLSQLRAFAPAFEPSSSLSGAPEAVCDFCDPAAAAAVAVPYTEFYEYDPPGSAQDAPVAAADPTPPRPTARPPKPTQPPAVAEEEAAPAPAPAATRTWSSVARGKHQHAPQPSILRRPRRFSGKEGPASLFVVADGTRAAVQLGVTDDDFRSLLGAAPHPVVVCEPSLAAARALLGTALPKGVTVTTVARAAVEVVGVDPVPAAYIVHLSPHLVATGIVAHLTAGAVARGARVAAYCRGTACPDGALDARVLGQWWGSVATVEGRKHQQPPPATARDGNNGGGDPARRLLAALATHAGPPPSLVVLAGLRDAVGIRKAVRRDEFNRLVSRVDIVTLRVHRPLGTRAAAALQSGCGRQSHAQSVALVPTGPDAHWGYGVLPRNEPDRTATVVLDVGSTSKAELTARAALAVGSAAVVTVGGAAELQAPLPSARPPAEADYLHALAPPGALLAEVLRVRGDPGLLAASPALALLVAWGLVRPGKEEVVGPPSILSLGGPLDCTEKIAWCDAADDTEDLFAARRVTIVPPAPEPALNEWALLAAEWVSDRAALLALVGARFCTEARFGDAARADEALSAWLSLVGVFDVLSTETPDGVVIHEGARAREEFQRHRAKALGLVANQTDDFETAVKAAARMVKLDPDTVSIGSTCKEATAWCSAAGLRAQALHQVAEGASACADGLRAALKRVVCGGQGLAGLARGEHPLDRFISAEDATAGKDVTAAFYRAASTVGPVFVARNRGGHGCTCCPTPARAVLESSTVTAGKSSQVVPLGARLLPNGKIVIESALRRR